MPDTTVAVVGSGPAAEAVRAALADADCEVRGASDVDEGAADLGVVAGVTGSDAVDEANRVAVEADIPLLAVEAGGVGGHPRDDVAASVAGFEPGRGCHRCLALRVSAAGGEDAPGVTTARPDIRLAGARAGREAVRALEGDPVGGTVVEVPDRPRSFLPVPNCPVCGGARDRTLERGHREVSLDDAVRRAERAVDDRVGVVTAVGERDSYPAPYYLATLASTEETSDAVAGEHAAGVAADWDRAYVKAVGEALERYAAGVYREADLAVAATADLDDAVPVSAFVRPDDAPAPDPDERLRWVPGVDLHGGESVRLPAEFVHFPPPEERFRPAITTGLGLGNSVDEALAAGLSEVLERDATMLSWYSTYEPLGLAVDAPAYRELERRARSEGLSATALLVTQDVDVPVVAVAVHREEWPRFAAGSAAGFDPDEAATDALAEALQNWMELRAMGPERSEQAGGAVARYADFPREVRDLVAPETTVPAGTAGPSDPPTGAETVDALLDRAGAVGLDCYAARLTTRDLEALGFEAVRVVVPEAQPLFVDDAYFGERARSVPRDLGFRPRLDRPFHPFP